VGAAIDMSRDTITTAAEGWKQLRGIDDATITRNQRMERIKDLQKNIGDYERAILDPRTTIEKEARIDKLLETNRKELAELQQALKLTPTPPVLPAIKEGVNEDSNISSSNSSSNEGSNALVARNDGPSMPSSVDENTDPETGEPVYDRREGRERKGRGGNKKKKTRKNKKKNNKSKKNKRSKKSKRSRNRKHKRSKKSNK